MQLELEEFKERLVNEMTKGTNPAHYIQAEIRQAEDLKQGLAEEVERGSQFVTEAINKIDTYIFFLHEMAKKYPLDMYQLDQKTAVQDDEVQNRIKKQLGKLDDEADPEAPGKVNPLDLS
jgi:predicted oxidoreductase